METQELAPREPNQDEESEWIKIRDASRLSGLSVPRIYQLAYGDDGNGRTYPSPFITKEVTVGRIRRELRIWKPSFDAWLATRPNVNWGPQLVGMPA